MTQAGTTQATTTSSAAETVEDADKGGRRAWLRPFLTPLKPTFREVMVVSLFVNLLALSAPVFVMQVYDRVVFHGGLSTLQGLAIGMAVLLIFDYLLRQTRSKVMQTVALKLDVQVSRRLFDKIMALPLATLESKPAPYWQLLFRDVDTVRNTLSGASAVLVADLPFVFLFVGLIFVIAQPVAWVLLMAVVAFGLLAWRSSASVGDATEKEKKAVISRDTLIGEIIQGRTTIKALALEPSIRPAWEDRMAGSIEEAIDRGSRTDTFVNLGAVMTVLTTVAMTVVGALAILEQNLTIGGLIAANMLSGRLFQPLNQLVGTWRNFNSFKQSLDRLGELFDEREERTRPGVSMDRPKGRLTVESVTFSYPGDDRPAIDGVKLEIEPGGMTAILGRNGSGKTTMLKLLQGLYTPDEGRVLLDKADLTQFTRAEIASWIGYVPQENVLFQGSIRDNIAQGAPDTDDDTIVKAARMAGVESFVRDMPDGYSTDVGEAGRRLSGGMRQRLAIARALAGDPPVLLLDEPSGSLDRQAEQELRDTLAELARDRTVVLVTHSPTLLSSCRTLVVMERGRVAANGPASEILPRLAGRAPNQAKEDQGKGDQGKGDQGKGDLAKSGTATPAPASAPAAAKATATSVMPQNVNTQTVSAPTVDTPTVNTPTGPKGES